MKLFLAGIMQGSHRGRGLHDQEYRRRLCDLIRRHIPRASVYDPFRDHQNSVDYPEEEGRRVFLEHNRMCGCVDGVIAFVPEASMGTAIEMWEGRRGGAAVLTVSPLTTNWSVRFLSDAVYADLAALEGALASGEVERLVESRVAARAV